MRGLAFKMFISFWIIFAVLIASFAILPGRRPIRLTDHVREDGLVAAALIERQGKQNCTDFSAALEQQQQIQLVLFDAMEKPVCHAPAADLSLFESHVPAGQTDVVKVTATGTMAVVAVATPSGARFTAAGRPLPAFNALLVPPPFPYDTVGLAIFVSGLVCFIAARYLARPLQHVRDASYRLAAGDLAARAGENVSARRDEIGDLVRDFDRMAARIEALVHAQTQILSDISHELRSPLARLNVALELARRKAGPEAQADLERIEAESERMNDLIGRVLALARAESDKAKDVVVPDLVEIVRQVTNNAGYEAQRQHKSVSLRVAASPTVKGDPQLLASAVDNIVRNAVRYTPENSSVDVVIDRGDHEAIITIRDHGPGVPTTELERIFSPFHRVESARQRKNDGGGVGLGLPIARRAIAVHRGTITAEDASGGGLLVTIRIPIDKPHSG